jgi:glutathione peroxidase
MSTKSVYEININSVDGEDNFLSQFMGKVTLFINVTGHCGNAPQFDIVQKLYDKYNDRGFQVIAIPTNDYCGPGVTYGIYEDGICDGNMAREYATKEWGVTYPFTELVVSREDRDGEDPKGRSVHDIYKFLNPGGEESPINGNFEKFLVDKTGHVALRLANGVLLDFAYKDGYCRPPEVEFEKLCSAIEFLLDSPDGVEVEIGKEYFE